MSTTCLYSTVINTSGKDRVFGFLGKHGRRLVAGAQHTEPGNLFDKLAKKPRHFAALERALANHTLAILQTPAVHVYDATLGRTQVVRVDNGTLGFVAPCWGPYEAALTAAWTPIADTTAAVSTATLTFTDPVTGFSVADLSLTRDAAPVALTGVTVATGDGGKTWTVSGLAGLTATNGAYIIKVTAAASGITDVWGNPLAANATEGWAKST